MLASSIDRCPSSITVLTVDEAFAPVRHRHLEHRHPRQVYIDDERVDPRGEVPQYVDVAVAEGG